MKIAYVTMAFDLPHRGHYEFLDKARDIADVLIVGLHPDDVLERYKRKPIMCFEDRSEILWKNVDISFVVEDCMDFRYPTMFHNIKKHEVNLLIHGDGWLPPLYKKARDEGLCGVIQVPRWPGVSTTEIIRRIKECDK